MLDKDVYSKQRHDLGKQLYDYAEKLKDCARIAWIHQFLNTAPTYAATRKFIYICNIPIKLSTVNERPGTKWYKLIKEHNNNLK